MYTSGSGGKGSTRMRPKLHLRGRGSGCPVWGTLFGVIGGMAWLVVWKAARSTVLYHIDLFESSKIQTRRYRGGSPSCLVTLCDGPRLRPSNKPDVT
jgi:hypothetical protein